MTANGKKLDYQALLKAGYVEIKALRARLDALERRRTEPIAIVGMGCRFPGGANDLSGFWRVLRDGVDGVGEIPDQRWDVDAFYDADPDAPGRMYVRRAALIEDVDKFDNDFFGISPREAESMDPQQRLLLETGWEALENAAIRPDRLVGTPTGMYVGVMFHDYGQLLLGGDPRNIDTYAGTGNGVAFLAGRLSYHLGLQGPAVVMDTACSSSLVAVHQACQSLRSGEIDLALAGGANLILSPTSMIVMCKLRALAADGRCKTFDAAADGYARGEGCGMVVLKRLSDALADGDRVWAVIRGSAVNQDGASAGMTVPNGLAQQAVIRQALAAGGVEPGEVGYVEAHGTGTRLGDPLEIRSMAAVLRPRGSAAGPLAVGSVKTNVGHMEGAAGVGALIKAVLAVHHGRIPPHLHLRELNPIIAEEGLPVRIPTELTEWPAGFERRIAGVSSFGLSGTNAHVVVAAAGAAEEVEEAGRRSRGPGVLALSAKSAAGVATLAGRYRDYLAEHPEVGLADACHTANVGRAHFECRLAVVARSVEELRAKLEAAARGGSADGVLLKSSSSAAAAGAARSAEEAREALRAGDEGAEAEPQAAIESLERLARAYVNGAEVDWEALDRGRGCRKVTLPTYPFERRRHWLRHSAMPAAGIGHDAADAGESWTYEVRWEERPIGEAAHGDGAAPDRWLVVADAGGFGNAIADGLKSRGCACTVIDRHGQGPTGRRLSEELARAAGDAGDKDGGRPVGVVFVAPSGDGIEDSSGALGSRAVETCAELVEAVQALVGARNVALPRLWVITRGTQRVGGDETEAVALEQAPLWGLAKVIGLEHAEVWGGIIDLPAAGGRNDVDFVLRELLTGDAEEQVALRGGARFVPRLAEGSAPADGEARGFEPDGTYVIAGGLGAIGLAVARWMVERGARRLVLIGRSALPPREAWSRRESLDAAVAAKVAAIQALEACGAAVETFAADVGDAARMAELRRALGDGGHALRGIVHAAGVSRSVPLVDMRREELEATLRAKVQGTLNLQELGRGAELEFFVCFSSIASVWGSRGLGHYAAANAFLDAFAHHRRSRGLAGLTVNWGPWRDGGVGEASDYELLSRIGIRSLPPKRALKALGRLMASGTTQATVADVDWDVFKPVYEAQRPRPFFARIEAASAETDGSEGTNGALDLERLRLASPDEQRRLARQHVLRQLSTVLKVADGELDASRPLNTLGVDSLMAMELQNRLGSRLGVKVPLSSILQGGSAEQLAGHIASRLAEGVRGSASHDRGGVAEEWVEGEL